MLWVLAIILVIGMWVLGFFSARALRRPGPPDRRVGDRRVGPRRAAESAPAVPPAPATAPPATPPVTERRTRGPDRRGKDRRRGRKLWPIATVLISSLMLAGIGVVTYAETRVGSFFAQSQPELIGSGWAACDTPVTWSLDTGRLSPAEAKVARAQMTADFAKWSAASGLVFQFVGDVPIVYDDATLQVTSTVHPSERHIFVGFLHDADSSFIDSRTVGFAAPSKVFVNRKEIVEGSIVLSIEYVEKVSGKKESALYLHEIGHALGLGHGTEKADVMYPIVGTNNDLSPADIEGIRALIQACKPGASAT